MECTILLGTGGPGQNQKNYIWKELNNLDKAKRITMHAINTAHIPLSDSSDILAAEHFGQYK